MTLGDHDGVLEVVTFPRHERHFQVTTQAEFTILGSISLTQDLTLLHLLSFEDDRLQVDTGALVGLHELGELVGLHIVFEADHFLMLFPRVANDNLVRIHILDAVAFGVDQVRASRVPPVLRGRYPTGGFRTQ